MKLYIKSDTQDLYMQNFRIIRNHDDYSSARTFTYLVIADSKRFGNDAIVYESYNLESCAEWVCNQCEHFLSIYDKQSTEYMYYLDVIKKFSKRPITIDSEYDAQSFEDSQFNEISPIIKQGVQRVTDILSIDISPDMFKYDESISKTHRAVGLYHSDEIHISIHPDTDASTVVHEIGHYVHHRYFGCQRFRFPSTKNRTAYSLKNFQEAFAEIFVQFIYVPDSSNPNVRYMRKLLASSNLLK